MKLPTEITPNPLILTPVELRFDIQPNKTNFFSDFYRLFSTELPKLDGVQVQFPKEIKEQNPNLRFQPDYKLSNDNYSVSIGQYSFLIETLGNYPLWNNYFSFIKNQVQKLFELNIIQNITRIGVRYGSIFQNTSAKQVLEYFPHISIPDYTEKTIVQSAFDFIKDDISLRLQIAENAVLTKPDKIMVGTYIDIDASYNSPHEPNENVLDIIERLHSAEKELFYKILKSDFLATLNPKY